MRKITKFEPLTKRENGIKIIKESSGPFLGIEGLEPSRFLKSTDFPLTINFLVVDIDM